MLAAKDGLNLYLADAKVKEGGKEMGCNIYWAPSIVASHCLTHSILMKWHQTWWNPQAQTMWSALCLDLPALFSLLDCSHMGSLHSVARWPPAAPLSCPPSFASSWMEVFFFPHLYSNLGEIQIGLILSHSHDWTNHPSEAWQAYSGIRVVQWWPAPV